MAEAAAFSEDGTLFEYLPARRNFYGDCGLRLVPDDIKTFGDELQALYEKYLTLGKAEGEPCFLSVGFTPC